MFALIVCLPLRSGLKPANLAIVAQAAAVGEWESQESKVESQKSRVKSPESTIESG